MSLLSYGVKASDIEIYHPSFTYDGEQFSVEKWSPLIEDIGNGQTLVTYTSQDGKLRLKLTYKRYSDFPVIKVTPVIECVGDAPTGIVEQYKSLEYRIPSPSSSIRIRRVSGSMSTYTDFIRHDVLLQDRPGCSNCSMSSVNGRSYEWIPYYGVDFNSNSGLEVAIGWTGTWKVDFATGNEFSMNIGLGREPHFRLLPGESYMLPYVVIYEREGESVEQGQVGFHRFLVAHNSPRDSKGQLWEPFLPLAGSGGNKTDDRMLTIIQKATDLFKVPFNVFWVDAGWYGPYHEVDQVSNCGPYWYVYAGDWRFNRYSHPDGNLKKVSDAAHAKGMKFLLWFEPERATIEAPIVSEHPEYFHRVKNNPSKDRYLLDMGNKDAREWITSTVCNIIEESGVDIYRQDFNFEPGDIWYDNDEPDRVGIMEISHINGLYAYWDALKSRFPDLMFESCAGGGTRMDIEMMSRAHSYCRDDAHMFPDCEELVQNITINSTAYIPFTGGETFTVKPFDSYAWMSCIGAGTVFTPFDFQGMLLSRDPSKEEIQWFNHMLTASSRVRPYFSGDFYNISQGPTDASDIFCGYQLHKGQDGFFMVFRRKDCQASLYRPQLRNIDPNGIYLLENYDGKTVKIKGAKLADFIVSLDSPRSYALYFYSRIK